MNLIQSVKKKLLNGEFLIAEELTQDQYNLITAENPSSTSLLALHDELFGGNLRRIPSTTCTKDHFLRILR